MNAKGLRECAILRYESGGPPNKIYWNLSKGKGKAWFFRCLSRRKLIRILWI